MDQYEYKLSDCKNENIEEYIEAYNEPINNQEHSDLFIQGNSVTAEQIEALD